MRSFFSDTIEGAAIFGSVSPPPKRVDQVRIAQSPYARSEAIGHTEAVRLALGPLRLDHHLLLFFFFFFFFFFSFALLRLRFFL